MAQRSIRQRLGSAIRERRETIRLTQETAAERAAVSSRYWRSLEAGRPAVAMEVVERVLAGLDWSWIELIEAISPEVDERTTPKTVRRFLDEAWKQGSSREREIIRALLQLLARGRRAKGR